MGRKAEKQNEQRRLDGIEKKIGETNESMAKLKGKVVKVEQTLAGVRTKVATLLTRIHESIV